MMEWNGQYSCTYIDICSLNCVGFDSFKGKKEGRLKKLVSDYLLMITKPSFMKEEHNDSFLELHEAVLQM